MTRPEKTVLLIEDDPQVLAILAEQFKRAGWSVCEFERAAKARKVVASWLDRVSVAVVDYRLSETEPAYFEETGLTLGLWIKKESFDRISVGLLTAHGDQELAARAIKRGLDDYWVKGISEPDLLKACDLLHELSESRRRTADALKKAEAYRLLVEGQTITTVGGVSQIALDERMRRTIADIELHIARSLMPVLIVGETGTGKEAIAREIHLKSGIALSERPGDNFRAVNCAAFTETLLMSELFGHVKGAYTGADSNRLGVVLEAAGVRAKESETELRSLVREMLDELWKVSAGDRKTLIRQFANVKEVDTFYARVVRAAQKIEEIEQRTGTVAFRHWLELCGNTVREDEAGTGLIFPELGTATRGYSGTLFLDEIADLPAGAQAALLRFLDGYGIRPVGYSGLPLRPRVRIIAATNRTSLLFGASVENPAVQGSDGCSDGFRRDLLWRLAGWIIELPSLSRRVDDALGAAIRRAAADDGEGKDRYGGRTLELTPQAQMAIREMVESGHFSGREPLSSGNFRNLNWLVDRACWITISELPEGKRVDESAIRRAAAMVLELEARGQAVSFDRFDGGTEVAVLHASEEEGLSAQARWLNLPVELQRDDLPEATAAPVRVLYARGRKGAVIKKASVEFPGVKRAEERLRFYLLSLWAAGDATRREALYGVSPESLRSSRHRHSKGRLPLSGDRKAVEEAIIARLLQEKPQNKGPSSRS